MIRINLVLLFWCLGILMAQAQQEAINLNVKEMPLQAVFEQLHEDYGVLFFYEQAALMDKLVSLDVREVELSTVLKLVCAQTQLQFEIVSEGQILIFRAAETETTSNARLVSAKVVDATTGEPLSFATISISETDGLSADENGRFRLRLDCNTMQQVQIHYVGYQTQTVPCEAITKDQFTFRLSLASIEISSVTITDFLPKLQTDSNTKGLQLRGNAIRQIATLGGKDLFRSLQLLPGITAHDEQSASLRVRGSSSEENMIILDGITLYKVDHFFGIFSAVNAEIIQSAQLHKNAFPAEYGGRTASILEITSKLPQVKTIKGKLSWNPLFSNVYLQLPLSPNMGFTIGTRVSSKNIADTQLFNSISSNNTSITEEKDEGELKKSRVFSIRPNFNFYDLHAKWYWTIAPSAKLQVNFFQSYDDFALDYRLRYRVRVDRQEQKIKETFKETTDWSNLGVSTQWSQQWNENLSSDLQFSHSRCAQDGILTNKTTGSGSSHSSRPSSIQNKQDNQVRSTHLKWNNTWQINPKQQLNFGYNAIQTSTKVKFSVDRKSNLQGNNTAQEQALYAQHQNHWTKYFQSTFGLRLTHYSLQQQLFLSPRLQLTYTRANWLLKTAASQYNQFLREPVYEDRFGRQQSFFVLANNDRYPHATAQHLMFGGTYTLPQWSVDIEFYQRNTTGLIEYALINPGFNRDQSQSNHRPPKYTIFTGDGETKGIDLLLHKYRGHYQTWIAYTLSKSTRQFHGINKGLPFAAQDDRRHQLKWHNSYHYNRWQLSTTYIFVSGRPYLDFNELNGRQRSDLLQNDLELLPNYHRADIGVQYQFLILNNTASIGASIFNLFNYQNVKYRQQIYSIETSSSNNRPLNLSLGTDLKLLDRTYNIEFGLAF